MGSAHGKGVKYLIPCAQETTLGNLQGSVGLLINQSEALH